MRNSQRLKLRFSSLQLLLLLLLLWAARRPCAAGDDEEEEEEKEDAGHPGHKDHHWSYKAQSQPTCTYRLEVSLLAAAQIDPKIGCFTGTVAWQNQLLPSFSQFMQQLRDMPEWGSMFPHCEGHMQSPININTTAVSFSAKLGPLLLSGYNVPPEVKLPLKNNGHTEAGILGPSQIMTVSRTIPEGDEAPTTPGDGLFCCFVALTFKDFLLEGDGSFSELVVLLGLPKKMTLGGGGFPQPYQAAQLHLHWGSGLTRPGSEHTVDGYRYAGEIHVVHYSSHFESIQEAASEPGGLAVLAAFLQVGMETNEPYQHILKHLSEIKEEGEETVVAGFDIAKLLPNDFGRYFRYNGSLTTPPCYQTVNWTVFNQTVRLSQEQISMLEDTLRGDEDEPIQSNFRHLQDLYGRSIFSSFHSLEKVQPTDGGLSSPLPDGAPSDRLDPLDSGKDGAPRDGLDPPDSGKDGTPRDGLDPPDSGKDGTPRDGLDPPDSGKDGTPRDGLDPPDSGKDGTLRDDLDPPDSGKDGAPRDGLDPPDSGKDAEKQVNTSLHTGDILAIVFGSLFVATALAFLFYIHKHRRLASRHRGQATKPAAIYVPASTDEQAL